jgi:hypothetical protein
MDGAGALKQPIRQGRLSVIDVRDDAENCACARIAMKRGTMRVRAEAVNLRAWVTAPGASALSKVVGRDCRAAAEL